MPSACGGKEGSLCLVTFERRLEVSLGFEHDGYGFLWVESVGKSIWGILVRQY